MAVPKIIRRFVNIIRQRWTFKLEVNFRQSFKPVEAFKTDECPVFINTEKFNNIMM
jgi:hypothetical protein